MMPSIRAAFLVWRDSMIHQYKLLGYNIVLDICSGSVHAVDELAYDIISMFEQNDTAAIVPDLRGKTLKTAVDMAQDNSLNIGRLRYDESVVSQADSSAAIVYSQRPSPSEESVLKGAEITLYLTLDESKLKTGK